MAQMAAGRAIVEALKAEGVDHIFGLVGTTTNSIVTELYGRDDIRFIDTRHEEGAAFMAYGYSKASGKPSACVTTSGPGTINLATGISLAYKGRAPVIAIAGNTAQEYTYRDGAQEFDLVNTFKPITQMSLQVNQTDRIPELLHYAFRAALYGKKGPVLLDIPRDLIDGQTIEWDVEAPGTYRPVADRTAGDAQAIAQAAALLAQARRPLILAGGGIVDSESTDDAVALAERLDMAVVPSYGHNDAFPNSHRLYVGPPGGRGASEAPGGHEPRRRHPGPGHPHQPGFHRLGLLGHQPRYENHPGGHRPPGDWPQLPPGRGHRRRRRRRGPAACRRPVSPVPGRQDQPGVDRRDNRLQGPPPRPSRCRGPACRRPHDAPARLHRAE